MLEIGFIFIYNPKDWTIGFAAVQAGDKEDETGFVNTTFAFRFLFFGLDFCHYTYTK